ncbi:type II toxin-antitoxin system VapC family toxin [Candidatus Poribacteria bacterium]|nr:type II toxin-antitoxin system VapC family toxin [Candidatus Poribacteria bacterium]
MELIVDASSIIAVLLEDKKKPKIIELTSDTTLVSPSCLIWEIGNALSALIKRKRINSNQAQEAIKVFKIIPIKFLEIELAKAVALAAKYNIYAYDAYYIEAAIRYKRSILTLDDDMKRIGKLENINFLEV